MTHIPHPTIMAQTLAREIAALGVELDQAKALALVERMHARHQGETEDLFEGKLVDWQDHPAPRTEDVKEWQASLTRHGVQLNFNLAPPHKETKELDGRDQLALWVEVNDGRPCMHISTALYGDQVLTIFSTADGLFLRPNDSLWPIVQGRADASSAELAQVYDEQYPKGGLMAEACAFIAADNR